MLLLLLVSAKPGSVLLLLTEVLVAIHVTYHLRRFVMLHTHHPPDKERSQVQVSYINEKMSVCTPDSRLKVLCFAQGSGQSSHMTHNELVSYAVCLFIR